MSFLELNRASEKPEQSRRWPGRLLPDRLTGDRVPTRDSPRLGRIRTWACLERGVLGISGLGLNSSG
jgi:hypothetical protein